MGKGIRFPLAALLAVLLMTGMLTGCSPGTPGEGGSSSGGETGDVRLYLAPEDYPRVDGSTVTIPLSEAFAATVMHLSIEEARQYILHNKTHSAYINLVDRKADIIFVTSPSEEELTYAKDSGIELEVVPIVSEGFVFLASSDNPVDGLSLQQIRDIYSGKIINWKDVGGADKKIIAYQRPENSGSQTGMLDLVMGSDGIMEAPTEKVIAEMGGLVDAVAVYTNEEDAIGYSYYYYVTDMWLNDKVKLLAVDGVYPDKETVSDGSYPIRTAYYAVLRSDEPKDSNARKLLEWILSKQGQQIAEEAGYVKLGK
ncbi:MAG TPA: substrate-binding domain-containing protein [Anaerovoracaceae bacterium]|nr:substrate-binding domain-containing protein [Anaerovoracaceae bacterium]